MDMGAGPAFGTEKEERNEPRGRAVPVLVAALGYLMWGTAAFGFSYDEHRRISNWALALAIACVEDESCNPGPPKPLTEAQREGQRKRLESLQDVWPGQLELLRSFLYCEADEGERMSPTAKIPCSMLDERDPRIDRPRFSARTFGDFVALVDKVGTAHFPYLPRIGEFEDGARQLLRAGDAAVEIDWPRVDLLATRTSLSKRVDAMHSNVHHFQGDAVTAFRHKHADTTALAASGDLSLIEAMVRTAAALHYLQDLHAPGHVVTARSDMHDIASNALHDRANALGVEFCRGGEDLNLWREHMTGLTSVLAARVPDWLPPYDADCADGGASVGESPGTDALVCLSAVRNLDNRMENVERFLDKPKKQSKERRRLGKLRAATLAADRASLEALPGQLPLLGAEPGGDNGSSCHLFRGDSDLIHGDAQLAYLTLVSSRAILDTLVSYRYGSDPVNSLQTFSWLPLSKTDPDATTIAPAEVHLNYGSFRFGGPEDGNRRKDDPTLRATELLIASYRGQALTGDGEQDVRPEYRLELPIRFSRPRTAVAIRRDDFQTEAARKKGLQFVGTPFVVGGYSFTTGDGYEAHGLLLRGGVYWRRLSGQLSVEVGGRYFDLRQGSGVRPFAGAQVEWGYSLFALSLGLSRDYRLGGDLDLEPANSIGFGISFYVPRRRVAKMLGLGKGRKKGAGV